MGGGDSGSELHAPFFYSACHLGLDARFGVQDLALQGEPPVESPALAPPAAGLFIAGRGKGTEELRQIQEVAFHMQGRSECIRDPIRF